MTRTNGIEKLTKDGYLMDLSKEQYEENFKGYIVMDCAVRSKDIFYFSLCTDDSLFPDTDEMNLKKPENIVDSSIYQRIVSYARILDPEDKWDCEEFAGIGDFSISVSKSPKEQMIGVDHNGVVFVYGSGDNGIEKSIPAWIDGGILRGGVSRCRTIAGHTYIAAGGRTVAKRNKENVWTSLLKGLPFVYKADWKTAGFIDIDGFSETDIYAVGGRGDVWHFDGDAWMQIHFPSNIHLYSACCAGGGEVYISGYQGNTFKGRGHKWRQIHKDSMTIPFKDMIWHENMVWCTSDYGLWQINDEKLSAAEVTSEIKVCAGHLSTCGDVLLLAGHSGAAYKEDGIWHKFF